MANLDIVISRNLLNQIKMVVRAQGYRMMRDAWVSSSFPDQWEFHGPEGYFWHGTATNAYEARYDGWCAWLKSKGVEGY